MRLLNLKIKKDKNKIKYISILRKYVNTSIHDLSNKIDNNEYVLSCDLFDTEKLISVKKIMEQLIEKGANVSIYKNNSLIDLERFNNIINSYQQIDSDIEKLDDLMFEDDD